MDHFNNKLICIEDLFLYGYNLYRRVRLTTGALYSEYRSKDGSCVILRHASIEGIDPLVVFTSSNKEEGHHYLVSLEKEVLV